MIKLSPESSPVFGPWPVIVLAAGASRRFGSDKRFARVQGDATLLERTLRECKGLARQRFLVLESERPVAMQLAQQYSYQVVIAERAGDGMGASIAAGVKALPESCDACWICPVDLPVLRIDSLHPLLDCIRLTPDITALAPEYEGQRGHPVWISRQHFDYLQGLSGDVGARDLWRSDGPGRRIAVDHAGVILDADTPSALRQILEQVD